MTPGIPSPAGARAVMDGRTGWRGPRCVLRGAWLADDFANGCSRSSLWIWEAPDGPSCPALLQFNASESRLASDRRHRECRFVPEEKRDPR